MVENPPRKLWPYLLSAVVVGSALGALFAPKPGKETRKQLKDLLHRGKERAKHLRAKLPIRKSQLLAAIKAGREALRENHNGHHRRAAVHA